jgi:hypothetical protein
LSKDYFYTLHIPRESGRVEGREGKRYFVKFCVFKGHREEASQRATYIMRTYLVETMEEVSFLRS